MELYSRLSSPTCAHESSVHAGRIIIRPRFTLNEYGTDCAHEVNGMSRLNIHYSDGCIIKRMFGVFLFVF